MKKSAEQAREHFTPEGKRIIYAPAPPAKPFPFGKKKKRRMSALEAVGGKRSSQKCPRCGAKTALVTLATHECPRVIAKVRVRKRSSLPKKQHYIKVKSHFQQKLSDESGGWY